MILNLIDDLSPQSVIANSHPDGSFFMTNNGTYVQLVNGVLTNVEVAPPPQPQVRAEIQLGALELIW